MEIKAFVYTIPTAYQSLNDLGKKNLEKQIIDQMQARYVADLPNKFKRMIEIKSFGIIKAEGKWSELLNTAISLYAEGFYLPTIAMCGMTAERICMELVTEVKICHNEKELDISQKEALFEIPFATLVEILEKCGVIKKEVSKRLFYIIEVRNRYVHPKMKEASFKPKSDSLEMINALREVVLDLFSILK